MAAGSAERVRAGSARVALLGAASREGTELREVLAEARVDGRRVDLFGYPPEPVDGAEREAQLGEYAGEARLIEAPTLEDVRDHDVVFVCEPGPVVGELLAAEDRRGVLIDVVGALPASARATLVDMTVDDRPAAGEAVLAAPHPLALILARVLRPLHAACPLEHVVVTALRPAADFGKPAIDELREQTVRLLNFAETPTDALGRQLAFNVAPSGALRCEPAHERARIRAEALGLMGQRPPRLALALVSVPVFYGHALQVDLFPRSAFDADAVRRILADTGGALRSDATTPLDTTGEEGIHVARVEDDGAGGVALWVLAGEAQRLAATNALALARAARPV